MLLAMAAMLVLVGGARGSNAPCSEQEHRRMQERFTSCRSSHARAHHERGGDICQLLQQVVKGCGEVWQECHDPSEIRTLETMHVEAMVAQGPGLEDCPLYKQYRYIYFSRCISKLCDL